MYAIIKTGGKQYRVSKGQALRVEKLDGEVGDALDLEQVLLVGGDGDTRIGTPFLDGAKVGATIKAQGRAKKIIVFKKKRRKGYHKKQGHRQAYTEIEITGISA
ncbi:MAG: 50S ribosomal protein L21 [Myxococcales bacterium]|nr:50S ribosomal protein L21 [Myxococcales bacterium]